MRPGEGGCEGCLDGCWESPGGSGSSPLLGHPRERAESFAQGSREDLRTKSPVIHSMPYCLLNLHWAPNFRIKPFSSPFWGVGGGTGKVPQVEAGKGDGMKRLRTEILGLGGSSTEWGRRA